ncbi:hypothetical protein AMTR_s00210p00022930 [Amborella trichopoda]|uniref:NAC domain-containing protein n=1 Tax=Amborella trichopoda TaxID=13333 RepID=W1NT25_AMBTC|nr:hypothetical protein AMTR_s00210p00022930 [Amborella trichopoda]
MASNGTANGAGIPRPPPGPPQPFMLHVRFPMGVRFCPSDEELMYYLAWRHLGVPLPTNFILEEDLYHLDPWELPDMPASFCNVEGRLLLILLLLVVMKDIFQS